MTVPGMWGSSHTALVTYTLTYNGQNIVTATPDVFGDYTGNYRFTYAGNRLVAATRTLSSTVENYTLSYNTMGLLDTLTANGSKYAFTYTGTDVTGIATATINNGQYNWFDANRYFFTLSDGNVLKMINSQLPGPVIYTTASTKNNLAQSLPVWLLMSNITGMNNVYSYPLYMNKDLVNSLYDSAMANSGTIYVNETVNGKLTSVIDNNLLDNSKDTIWFTYQ